MKYMLTFLLLVFGSCHSHAREYSSGRIEGASALTNFSNDSQKIEKSVQDELDLWYACGDEKISDMLKSDLIIFDSLEGVNEYIQSTLPDWAKSIVTASSEAAINEHLSEKITMEAIKAARNQFLDNLQQSLIDNAKKDEAEVGDCGFEVAHIMESLHENKIYNLFNNNFRRVFLENGIPLELSTTDNYIDILILTSLPQLKNSRGVCKSYRQKGARNELTITICN